MCPVLALLRLGAGLPLSAPRSLRRLLLSSLRALRPLRSGASLPG